MQTSFILRFMDSLRDRVTKQLPAADCLRLLPAYRLLPKQAGDFAADRPEHVDYLRNWLDNARRSQYDLGVATYEFSVRCVEPEEMIRFMKLGLNSVRWAANALLYFYGVRSYNADVRARELGRLVVKNTLPRAWSAYAAGGYGDFNLNRIHYCCTAAQFEAYGEGEKVIAQGLRMTRARIAQRIRAQVQANPNTAIRCYLTGKPLTRLRRHQWSQMTWRFGYTTLFDVLEQLVDDHQGYTNLDGDKQQQLVGDFYHLCVHFNDLMEQYLVHALGRDFLLPRVAPINPSLTPALANAA